MRERLPDTRESLTHRFVVCKETPGGGHRRINVYFTVGLYPDGRPGELFFTVNDADATFVGMLHVWDIAVSLCLQSGVTLDKLVEKFAHQDFPPNGFVEGDPAIKSCTSVPDYVVRWMEVQFKK